MIERPILFSAPMVRALLRGRKTQTRRVAQTDGSGHTTGGWEPDPRQGWGRARPGDLLWVRETWYCDHMDCINKIPKDRSAHDAHADDSPLLYRADGECCEQIPECEHSGGHGAQWRPSIHMPRWASRITLEVTGVRAERLQDISEADAKAEGCTARTYRDGRGHEPAVVDFRDLWGKINGAESWAANPWVWVVTFKRVEAES